jgi:hypothetical protein
LKIAHKVDFCSSMTKNGMWCKAHASGLDLAIPQSVATSEHHVVHDK